MDKIKAILALLLFLPNSLFAYDFKDEGFLYNITNQTTKEVEVYRGPNNIVINIPPTASYNGETYSVTSIGNNAFSGRTSLLAVTIPNSVTTIGERAFFNCSNMRSLTIGSGVRSIGDKAFSHVTGFYGYNYNYDKYKILKVIWLGNTPPTGSSEVEANINYVSNKEFSLSNKKVYPFLSSRFEVDNVIYVPVSPSERKCDVIDCNYAPISPEIVIDSIVKNRNIELRVLEVNDYSFCKNDSITKLTISNSGNIGNYTFYECNALSSVAASNKGNIGGYAFYSCNNLIKIDLSNSGCIFISAFENCTSLETAVLNIRGYIGDYSFRSCKNLSAVTIGNQVTKIGENAFYQDMSLKEISLPDNITSLGGYAFSECTSLKDVSIGRGISSLPSHLFSYCSSLSSIYIPNNILNIGDCVFFGCKDLGDVIFEQYKSDEELTIKLGSNSQSPLFSDCPLNEVFIGRKLAYSTSSHSGYSPFYRNTSLRSVKISDIEDTIYDNEFYGCSNLQVFECGDGVTSIGNRAFSGCSALKSYLSGTSVKRIGQEAFSDCTAMTSFTTNAAVPPVCGNQALDDINKWECTLHVPQESIDDYQAAEQWKEFFFIEASGVEDVIADNEDYSECPVEIYNLSGNKVGSSKESLSPGIYIMRQGRKVEKIMIQ